MDKEPNNKNRLSLQSVRESLRTLSLSTLLLIVTTAVALVAVGSFAWVSRNRNLDSEGLNGNIDDQAFDISTDHELGQELRAFLTNLSNSQKFPMNSYTVLSLLTIERDEDGKETGFRPRATGTLDFIIAPNNATGFTATLDLSAIGYTMSNTGQVDYEYISEETLDDEDSRKAALDYMLGHVLFFKSRSAQRDSTGNYTYGDRVVPGEIFNIAGIDGTADEYRVTLFWEWPRTYERLCDLLGDDAEDYVSDHLNYFLTNSEIDPTAAFNDADTEIGMHIAYAVSEVTVIKSALADNVVSVTATPVTTP